MADAHFEDAILSQSHALATMPLRDREAAGLAKYGDARAGLQNKRADRGQSCDALPATLDPGTISVDSFTNRCIGHSAGRGNPDTPIGPVDADIEMLDLFPGNLDLRLKHVWMHGPSSSSASGTIMSLRNRTRATKTGASLAARPGSGDNPTVTVLAWPYHYRPGRPKPSLPSREPCRFADQSRSRGQRTSPRPGSPAPR